MATELDVGGAAVGVDVTTEVVELGAGTAEIEAGAAELGAGPETGIWAPDGCSVGGSADMDSQVFQSTAQSQISPSA